MDDSFTAFLAISAVVIATPGQDTALTIRNTLHGGRTAGIATAIGVALGQATWTLAASAGVTAILVASETAFTVVRLVGAAYLVYLGAHSLWSAVRGAGGDARLGSFGSGGLPFRRALRQGAISNLGNPKMALFFSSLLPQFVTPGSSSFLAMALLGFVFVSMTLAWLSLYAVVVARFGDLLRRPRIRRAIDAVMGTLLIAFGVRLAVAER